MRSILTLITASAVLAVACGDDAPAARDARTAVVASFYPIAEAARQVGGNAVDVVELTPAGVEPHDLELAPDDIEAVATADVVLYAGGGFQPAVEDALPEATGVVADVTDGLASLPSTVDELDEEGHDDEGHDDEELAADPHVWLDPTRFEAMVGNVADALGQADPRIDAAGSSAAYGAELEALDAAFRE